MNKLKNQKSILGSAKQSAKGVTKDARNKMAHEMYKQVLTGGETVRLVNTRIASSKHQLMTVVCNKKSLSVYDDKRYILDDRITTLPYGHHALREEMFMRNMVQDPDWSSSDEGETNVYFAESTMEQSPPVTLHSQLPETWSPPDPGFNQREYSEDEDDIVNFTNLTQQESEGELDRCSFIDDLAVESGSSPSLIDIRPVSPIHPSTTTLTRKQPINHPGQSKCSIKKRAKRTLELISEDESVDADRIKKWRVVQIDSDSEEN